MLTRRELLEVDNPQRSGMKILLFQCFFGCGSLPCVSSILALKNLCIKNWLSQFLSLLLSFASKCKSFGVLGNFSCAGGSTIHFHVNFTVVRNGKVNTSCVFAIGFFFKIKKQSNCKSLHCFAQAPTMNVSC